LVLRLRGGVIWYYWQREGEDPGLGGHPTRPAVPDLCWQATGGRAYLSGLQHPEGVYPSPGAAPPWWPMKCLSLVRVGSLI
jgi:hypothetical protein